MDGQQRATSLLVSILGGKGRVKEEENFDYTLYFDATDGTFFFAGDLEKHKARTNPAFLIRLKDVPQWGFDLYQRISVEDGFNQAVQSNLQQLSRIFTDYKVSLIRIKGVNVAAIVENGELIEPFVDRIVGRTSLERVVHPDTDELIVDMNEEIDERVAQKLQELGIESVKIRSLLTCESKRGVCQLCYGRDMATGHHVELGEAAGITAAQSIGEPGTQLTMRTFHVGGIAMRGTERSKLEAKNDGIIKFRNLNSVKNKEDSLIVVNRTANIAILDHRGREVEHYQVPYGAKVLMKDGEEVKSHQEFAEWDPFNTFILTEESGFVHFHDVVLGITMEEIQDEFTGKISPVIAVPREEKMQPQIIIKSKDKKVLSITYFLCDERPRATRKEFNFRVTEFNPKTRELKIALPNKANG